MTTCTIKLKWKQNSHCCRFIPINVGAAGWSKNGGGENWRTSRRPGRRITTGRKEMGVHRNDKVFPSPETENAHPQCV